MQIITTQTLSTEQKMQIMNLWNQEYPLVIRHNSLAAFVAYLAKLKQINHTLLIENSNIIKGWYADFVRSGERWFILIVSSDIQGKGYGKMLLNSGKETWNELNGWVVCDKEYLKQNGEMYRSPLEFYLKTGFKAFPHIKFETDVLKTIKITWKKENTI